MNDGWGPVQVSSYTPWWGRQGFGGRYADPIGYAPWAYLTPRCRWRLAHPQNYVIPTTTYVPHEPPYRCTSRTREERGRESFDLGFGGWASLGTRGG